MILVLLFPFPFLSFPFPSLLFGLIWRYKVGPIRGVHNNSYSNSQTLLRGNRHVHVRTNYPKKLKNGPDWWCWKKSPQRIIRLGLYQFKYDTSFAPSNVSVMTKAQGSVLTLKPHEIDQWVKLVVSSQVRVGS